MLISKDIKKIEGVYEVIVGMGTDLNKELAANLSVITEEVKDIEANDFFISAKIEDDSIMDKIIEEVDNLLNQKKSQGTAQYRPVTIESALKQDPSLNLALISVPGQYAGEEAKKALENGLHVMLFSDNVTIEEERKLKELARERGLLMMGPDCGTAIINHIPLAFANVIAKGNIGIVGASGTGIQEVTVLIDKLGGGISQVIGTGGRDLKSEIGGIMMIQGLEALMEDLETQVIVLISKPPAPEVAEKILRIVETSPKPVVVDFIGGDPNTIKKYGAYPCLTLEDTAHKAVALSMGQDPKDFYGFSMSEEDIDKIIEEEVKGMGGKQKFLRGLFTGGTLADEAMKLLGKEIGEVYSNIPLSEDYRLKEVKYSYKNTCIDLGDDEFTRGKPHPMIDPSIRVERLKQEAQDDNVAVILMDFVLGYGSHEDPIGEMLPAILEGKKKALERGQYLSIVASICGTEKDPQDLESSRKRLEESGVIVMPSNAQAVRLVSRILRRLS